MKDLNYWMSLERDLPQTPTQVDASIAMLASLGLVTEYPDGTVGLGEAHLRDGSVLAAYAVIGKREDLRPGLMAMSEHPQPDQKRPHRKAPREKPAWML